MKNNNEKESPIKLIAYEYFTMRKVGLVWMFPLCLSLQIAFYFDRYKYILIFTLISAVYGTILNRMKKKGIEVCFFKDRIKIKEESILLSEITDFCTSLPLNGFFLLRIKTKNDKNRIIYIKKSDRPQIEDYLNKACIPLKKNAYDIWIQYSHLSFALLIIFLSFIMYF